MPKPKPKGASPVFHSRPHHLKPETVTKLLSCLGYPNYDLHQEALDHQMPGWQVKKSEVGAPLILEPKPLKTTDEQPKDLGAVIRGIELALGLYVSSAKHLDEIPRPADYKNAFTPLKQQSVTLLSGLCGLGGYYRDLFAFKGEDIYALEKSLISLIGVCEAVQKDMEGKTSKGAKIDRAFGVSISLLLRLYREHAKSANKSDEAEFVKTALLDARILKPLPEKSTGIGKNKKIEITEEERLIDFDKKIKRFIRQADKTPVEPPQHFG